jgi:hypothetical protein
MGYTYIDGISLCLSVYAAIISTIKLCIDKSKDKSHIKISLEIGEYTYENGDIESGEVLFCCINNTGLKSVNLLEPRLRLKKGDPIVFASSQDIVKFPFKLSEGKRIQVFYNLDTLKKVLIQKGFKGTTKLKAIIEDETTKKYQTIWKEIDIN